MYGLLFDHIGWRGMFAPIDEKLTALAARRDATYTRYMDDLCFSSNQ